MQKIKGEVANWEQQYVIRSPIAGRLSFFLVWKPNQYVNSSVPVFVVVPAAQQYEIRAQLPVYKAGKIKVGQRVLIKMQEYPYEEFGMLQARVKSISNVALDSFYTLQLELENGFKTTRNRTIHTMQK